MNELLAKPNAFAQILAEYRQEKAGIDKIRTALLEMQDFDRNGPRCFNLINNIRFAGQEEKLSLPTDKDWEKVETALNARYWRTVYDRLNIWQYLSAAKRTEVNEQLTYLKDILPFTEANLNQKLPSLFRQVEDLMVERVRGIFDVLSRDHKTNKSWGFHSRMIIQVCSQDTYWLNFFERNIEAVADLRAVIAVLTGRSEDNNFLKSHDIRNTVEDMIKENKGMSTGEFYPIDGGAFQIKAFKKGTVHINIHPDIADELNVWLAKGVPNLLADKESARKGNAYKKTSSELVRKVIPAAVACAFSFVLTHGKKASNDLNVSKRIEKEVLNKYKLTGNSVTQLHDLLAMFAQEITSDHYVFSRSQLDGLHEVAQNRILPETVSHQFYPTPAEVALQLQSIAELDTGKPLTLLEPSIGTGRLVEAVKDDPLLDITGIDVSPVFAGLHSGIKTECADFMSWRGGRYDRILMNPPFTGTQAVNHVKKAALDHLASDGVLVTVLPASFKDKTVLDGWRHQYSDVIKDAFAGTSISVVLLKLKR